jgi:hypothetical protein
LVPFREPPLPDIDPSEIWERQPGEPAAAYEWFCVYRSRLRPSQRTLDNLRQVLADEGIHVDGKRLAQAARQYRWASRAAAYDRECDRLYAMALREQMREAGARQAEIARSLLQKGVEALENIDPTRLPPSEVRQFIVDAAKLERLVLGAPTDIVESREEEGRDVVAELSALIVEAFGEQDQPALPDTGQPTAEQT